MTSAHPYHGRHPILSGTPPTGLNQKLPLNGQQDLGPSGTPLMPHIPPTALNPAHLFWLQAMPCTPSCEARMGRSEGWPGTGAPDREGLGLIWGQV